MKTLFAGLVIRCLLGMLSFAPPTTAQSRYLTLEQEKMLRQKLHWDQNNDISPLAKVPTLKLTLKPPMANSRYLTSEEQQQYIEYLNLNRKDESLPRDESLPMENAPSLKRSYGSKPAAVSADLTPKQEQKILEYHNYYRSNTVPPAANMPYLVWDSRLARDARLWAEKCTFENFASMGIPYGQNNYWARDNTAENSAITWYEEKQFYDYSNDVCKFDEDCGRYKQMMFAGASRIGCGQKKCNEMYLLICYYNDVIKPGAVPYETGTPCSKCPEKGSKCYMNLCISPDSCASEPKICAQASCNLICLNCGKLDLDKCECQCAYGWEGIDCSVPCLNEDTKCDSEDKNSGYLPNMCNQPGYQSYLQKKCRKMCKLCNFDYTTSNLCCGGKICNRGYILNEACKCQLPPLINSDEAVIMGKSGELVQCNLKCQNCGKLDMRKCECQCAYGWEGVDCSVPCLDEDKKCDPKNNSFGFFPHMCNNPEYQTLVQKSCRKMCQLCNFNYTTSNFCCGGKICSRGYVLSESCKCNLPAPAKSDKPIIIGRSAGIKASSSPQTAANGRRLKPEQERQMLEFINSYPGDPTELAANTPYLRLQTKANSGNLTSQDQKKIAAHQNLPRTIIPASADNIKARRLENTLPKTSGSGFLTSDQKQKIIQYHNYYRNHAVPTAANMPYLDWDETLARVAELLAKKCTFESYSFTDYQFGQNLFLSSNNEPENSVIKWHKERQHNTSSNSICKVGDACGHYTQLMLARAVRIGCGQKHCSNVYFLVCLYNSKPDKDNDAYQTGTPCSKCPETGSKCYRNLCISPAVCALKPKLCANAHPL